MALAHGTGASIKVFLHTQIQEALHISEAMVLVQLQLGETHQATELVAVMDLVQLQLGETLGTQSVHAPAGAAN